MNTYLFMSPLYSTFLPASKTNTRSHLVAPSGVENQAVPHSTFLLFYLFWIFVCAFALASFLKLQHVSPNGNVLGHCSAFARQPPY